MSLKRFNAEDFSEQLSLINKTKDSIHNIAQWILEHKNHCFEITDVWLKSVQKADVSHRVTLFYVANDVVQQCKKQDASRYREAFANTLELAMPLANDDSIRHKIERLVEIWETRGIYHPDFLKGLQEKLTEPKVEESGSESPVNLSEVGNLKVNLNTALQELKKLTAAVRKQRLLGGVESFGIDMESVPSIGQTQGVEILRRLNPRIANAKAYLSAVEKETDQRRTVIKELEKTDKFYTQQLCDVQTVAKAYKAFGRKLKRIQKCLAERKALFASPGAKTFVSSSPSGGFSIQKEIFPSCEVSTLEKRLSLLTQDGSVQEAQSKCVKSDCSSLSVKSPQNSFGGHKQSLSELHSDSERVENSHMDVDPCSPASGKVNGSPNSSGSRGDVVKNSSAVSVQVIELTENKCQEKENQSVQLPKVNSPVREEFHNKPHSHSIELPKVTLPCEEDFGNQCTVQSKDLDRTKSPAEENCSSPRSNCCHCQKGSVPQAHPPICMGSKCLSIVNSAENDVILVCPHSNEATPNGHSCSDPHKELHMGVGNLTKNLSTCSVAPDMSKNSSNVCFKHAEGEEVSETTCISSCSDLQEPTKGCSCDEEVVILSENIKMSSARPSITQKNSCSPQMVYNMLQSVVAYTNISQHSCNSRTKSMPHERARDIVNLYSLLLSAPCNRYSDLKKNGEHEVITIVDENSETQSLVNRNKIPNQLPASAARGQGEKVTANLEVMDMDLESSDDEMA